MIANVDEYVEKVVDLLRTGNQEVLEDAAMCVFICSENNSECSQVIDSALECLANRPCPMLIPPPE